MFTQIIKDNQERLKNLKFKKRDYIFLDELLKLNKIISFVWPRRVWKTYLMFQFVMDLINKGVYDLDQIVFIDFTIYKWETIKAEDIIESYYVLWNNKPPLFVFDEIQDIENWQELILKLYIQWYKLFISGSNSKLLSSELVTEFRWRVFEYFVYPLNFKEILEFNDIKLEKVCSTKTLWKIKNLFIDIFKYWSFPEVVLVENLLLKTEILKTYFDILFYKDLIERYKIGNEKTIRFLIKRLIVWNTKKLNLIKIFNDLKSQWVKIGKNTVYEYYEYLKNIFFVDELSNFYKRFVKVYLYNFWFEYLFWYTESFWQNFENFIYLNLKKQYKKVFYKSNWWEIDFYLPDKDINIQVCYKLNEENIEREIKPLLKQGWRKILVYFEKEGEFVIEWVEIKDFFSFMESFFKWEDL